MSETEPHRARYRAEDLIAFATAILSKSGQPADRAATVARILVEADLMGHATHGLQLLALYARESAEGKMQNAGEPEILNDTGATMLWDGRFLPGPWLVERAIDAALERSPNHPVMTIAIRQSHHIACLAAYPERVARGGKMLILACSDPTTRAVAPFGAVEGTYSPNPLALGIPTSGDPIIVDISTSATAIGTINQAKKEGRKLAGPWLIGADGKPTDDPEAYPEGSRVLPLGGIDSGYKGFALGLMIEALTASLAGHGRADGAKRWGATVFLQIIDPAGFAGREAFEREAGWLAAACLAAKPIPGGPGARLPGQRAMALRDEQRRDGIRLHLTTVPALEQLAAETGVAMPDAI